MAHGAYYESTRDLEVHVPLATAAAFLGVAHRTLLNRAHLGTLTTILPGTVKVLGRYRVPRSAIRRLLDADTQAAAQARVRTLFRQVDYPHFEAAKTRPRGGRRAG